MRAKQILVVNDYEENRDVLSLTLAQAGYHVIIAGSAANALRAVKAYSNTLWSIDLLLTGFMMWDMTGLELIDRLNQEGIELPTVVTLEATDEAAAVESLGKRCVAHLQKPFAMEELIALVKQILTEDEVAHAGAIASSA